MSAEGPTSGAQNLNGDQGGAAPNEGVRPLRVLGIYPWNRFWSMGEFRGAPSFFLAPQALKHAGHDVHISMPAGGDVAIFSPGPAPGGTPASGGSRATAEVPGLSERGAAGEDYHGMRLHRYRFGIDFMPMAGHSLYIHLTRPFRYIYYLMLATVAGLRAARAARPDVVVGYGAWGAPVALLVGQSMGVPNVARLFGQSLPLGGGGGFRNALRTLLNYPEIIAFLTRCDCLIVCDDGSGGDRVAASLGVPAERLRFWRNGVDKGLFSPPASRGDAKAGLRLDPGAPMLLSVSRLDGEKHHERFVRALPEVLRSFPNARAYIIGEGPERAHLEAEIDRLDLGPSIELPGAVPQETLAEYYKACDVFLSLSDRTNIANPTLEAICCGACVVALDAGNTSGALARGATALLVKRENLDTLGGILVDLIGDDAKRLDLGRRAVGYAGENLFSIEERGRMEAQAVAAVVRKHLRRRR